MTGNNILEYQFWLLVVEEEERHGAERRERRELEEARIGSASEAAPIEDIFNDFDKLEAMLGDMLDDIQEWKAEIEEWKNANPDEYTKALAKFEASRR